MHRKDSGDMAGRKKVMGDEVAFKPVSFG